MNDETQAGGGDTEMGLRPIAIGYARVSTRSQGDSVIGIERQRAAIAAFANKQGWYVLKIFEEVASAVGADNFTTRQRLKDALQLAAQHDGYLLVESWSRLNRHVGAFADIASLLLPSDRMISVLEGNDFEDAVLAGQHAGAEAQGRLISERTKLGMNRKKADGVRFGSPKILIVQKQGVAGVKDKTDQSVRQIADALVSFEADHVKLTCARIADMVNAEGRVTGQGKPWTKQRLKGPLAKAHTLIAADDQRRMQALPTFGLF
jgi:DNA invertase Pin-like site-specific DNA recombinase